MAIAPSSRKIQNSSPKRSTPSPGKAATLTGSATAASIYANDTF